MNDVTFKRELEIFQKIYTLETISSDNYVDESFFNYVTSKSYYIILVVYNKDGQIYLKSSGINHYQLLSVNVDSNERIRENIKRGLNSIGITKGIEAIEPICFINQYYHFGEKTFTHVGIAFMIHIDSNETENINFYTLTEEILDSFNIFADKKILLMYKKRYYYILHQNLGDFQEKEIKTNEKYRKRYVFHNKFVKRFLLTDRIKKKEKLITIIKGKIGNASKLLDVSCGDNSLLFYFSQDIEMRGGFIVANDISYSQIELINRNDVFFTQHNAISLPFKENSFDVVYCSNTLHHIFNKDSLCSLLLTLLYVGKKVIIYEIENPTITGGFPKILNKYYYRGFLKDVGEEYLSLEQFKTLISTTYENRAIVNFSNFKNIQGNYIIAEIEKKDFLC